MTVKSRLGLAVVVLLTMVVAWAGSTKFVSTWKNPAATPIDKAGQKVAAFVITADESMRLGPEETLAAELRDRGVDSVAGYTVLPGELAKDLDKAKEFLTASGITGAVVLRVLGKEERLRTEMPGTAWYSGAYYPSFWNYWGYSWTVVYTVGPVQSDTVVSIEALVYSITQDQLIWAGRSETVNPKEIRKFVHQIVDAAGKEMQKAGLVKK